MKTIITTLLAALAISAGSLHASDVYVHDYYRSNGTHVDGYYRSSPNDTIRDNWSTRGNYNPYTGQAGTR
jgi:hypothetical protein